MNETTYDLSAARKSFSRIGLALCALLLIATVLQLVWFTVPALLWGEDTWMVSSSWGIWIGSFVPLYLVAIPVCLLIMKKLPAQTPVQSKLGGVEFLIFLSISVFIMYAGSFVGALLSAILSGGTAENAVEAYAMDTNPLKVLVMVVLAPLLEEYVCRKQIIDRTRQYGEKTAVFLSALTFGLLHQNFFQFFYAFGVGLVFGYIYIRTGRLRYSILLHGIFNFMGAVIAPYLQRILEEASITELSPNATNEELLQQTSQLLSELMIPMLYAMIVFGVAIAGFVLLLWKKKQLVWKPTETQLPRGTAGQTVFCNIGMFLYILLCTAAFILALL